MSGYHICTTNNEIVFVLAIHKLTFVGQTRFERLLRKENQKKKNGVGNSEKILPQKSLQESSF